MSTRTVVKARRRSQGTGLYDWVLDLFDTNKTYKQMLATASRAPKDTDVKQMAFTFALIGLCVHVMKSAGTVTKDTYLAFCDAFPLEEDASKKIRTLFELAWAEEAAMQTYTRQVVALYPKHKTLYLEVMERLSHIVNAAGRTPLKTLQLLEVIAEAFGLSRREMAKILVSEKIARSPLQVLGLKKGATKPQIKTRYRELMRRYHPDVAATSALPEILLLTERKVREINHAYTLLMK